MYEYNRVKMVREVREETRCPGAWTHCLVLWGSRDQSKFRSSKQFKASSPSVHSGDSWTLDIRWDKEFLFLFLRMNQMWTLVLIVNTVGVCLTVCCWVLFL